MFSHEETGNTIHLVKPENVIQCLCPNQEFFSKDFVLRTLRGNTTVFTVGIRTGRPKQTASPRRDAAECGISSGSTLFATHPAIIRHNIG